MSDTPRKPADIVPDGFVDRGYVERLRDNFAREQIDGDPRLLRVNRSAREVTHGVVEAGQVLLARE